MGNKELNSVNFVGDKLVPSTTASAAESSESGDILKLLMGTESDGRPTGNRLEKLQRPTTTTSPVDTNDDVAVFAPEEDTEEAPKEVLKNQVLGQKSV
jgi:hypothetical protein